MKRGAPMARTPFQRKNHTENKLQKVAQSVTDKGPAAIIRIVKLPAKTATFSNEFKGGFPKSAPVRNATYRRAVASLPCCICGIAGKSQAAHGSGAGTAVCKGMGLKSCDLTCFPACVRDHAALDQGAMFSKAARHALEPAWAADTQRRIHAMGKWPKAIPYPHDQQDGVAK